MSPSKQVWTGLGKGVSIVLELGGYGVPSDHVVGPKWPPTTWTLGTPYHMNTWDHPPLDRQTRLKTLTSRKLRVRAVMIKHRTTLAQKISSGPVGKDTFLMSWNFLSSSYARQSQGCNFVWLDLMSPCKDMGVCWSGFLFQANWNKPSLSFHYYSHGILSYQ